MATWHIHIIGRVQGVGFRPYVYRMARELRLNGIVYNDLDGVHIQFEAKAAAASSFYKTVVEDAPNLAKITGHTLSELNGQIFENFRILQKRGVKDASLMIAPDFALCESCKTETLSDNNRRALYPFTTCTSCGPRFSLVKGLPFEREFTAMDEFKMCASCIEEYANPEDRRYHSQTNSCDTCGIQLSLKNRAGEELVKGTTNILQKVVDFWKDGKIVAIKGIGGYLLTCDASNIAVINRLRETKQRPSKPFACMYPDIELVQQEYRVNSSEIELLSNEVAPIVLCKVKNENISIALNAVAPGLDQIGVMLPYRPLYEILLQKFGKPIIATSANISNASIVFEDDKIFSELSSIWDYVVTNDREIITSQDDSVVRFSPINKRKIIIRRSRGLAPNYFGPVSKKKEDVILAMGASQKSAFGLLFNGLFYLSQYLGDLAHYESTENYKRTIAHFVELLNCRPKIILVDKHPNYYSNEYGKELVEVYGAKLVYIQHHFAHFAGVLSEHSLLKVPQKVLGVIWDGNGYGNDGKSWGGEFLLFVNGELSRLTHFTDVPSILGDKMASEPRISALVHCHQNSSAIELLKDKFSKQEWELYQKIQKGDSTFKTSSMGRLFDAVACLLGIRDKQTYEGEAALGLETMAQSYYTSTVNVADSNYLSQISYLEELSTASIIDGVVEDLNKGVDKKEIAFKFHYSLVKAVKKIAVANSIEKIAFSGGVFQNGLLVDLMIIHLGDDFQLYFHQEVSPNDENIALGQLAYYQNIQK